MTFFECYEGRKDALYTRLASAKSLQEGSAALSDALDAMLCDYANGCKEDELREYAAGMTGALKASFPLLECASDTRIWQTRTSGEVVKAPKWPGVLCLAFGAAAIFGVIYVFFAQHPALDAGDWGGWALGIAAGAALIFAAGMFFSRSPRRITPDKTEQRVDVRLSAADAVRRLAASALQMDKSLDARASALAAERKKALAGGMSEEELALMCELLEGACSGSGEAALDSLAGVEHYLRRRGVDCVCYSGDNERYFELLPAAETATLRPALMSSGRLIKKGLAVRGEG